MSADGRWTVFSTQVNNVVPGDDNDASDSFLYDRVLGAITLIARDRDGSVPGGGSWSPTISADGRWVSFVGPAHLLGEAGDFEKVVYLWDRVEDRYRVVSPANAPSGLTNASISADGSHVAYVGTSGSDETTGSNVYLWSRASGSTTLVTADAAGMPLRNRNHHMPIPANDGAYVVFGRSGDNSYTHLHRWRAADRSTVLIDTRAAGGGEPDSHATSFSMSADGQKVAYFSASDQIVAGDGPTANDTATFDAFLWDGATGTNRIISRGMAEEGHSSLGGTRISADGRYVVHIVGNGPDQDAPHAIERIDTSTLASTRLASNPGTDPAAASFGGPIGVSPDGRYAVISSPGVHVTGDANQRWDLHVGDLEWGVQPAAGSGFAAGQGAASAPWAGPGLPPLGSTLISSRADGTAAGGYAPALSGEGRFVAFGSAAADLDPADAGDPSWPPNTFDDIFVRDVQTGAVDRITDGLDGTGANLSAYFPSISRDGTWVLYESAADNLAAGDRAGAVNYDLFLANRITGATTMVTRGGIWDTEHIRSNPMRGGALSPNGRYVAYWADFTLDDDDRLPHGFQRLHLYDRTTGATARMKRSPDYLGRTDVEGFGSWPVSVADDGTVAFVRRAGVIEAEHPHLSDSTEAKVYLWSGATPQPIATASPAGGPEMLDATGPDISADGSTVVFTSLVAGAGDANGVSDVHRYSVATGVATVVSAGVAGIGDDASFAPAASDDGGTVTFLSLATNLGGPDENRFADAYVWKGGMVQRVELRSGLSPNRPTDRVAVAGDGTHVAIDTEAWAGPPDTGFPAHRDVYRVPVY